MRRSLLTIGILLTLGGLLITNQGTEILQPIAETFGLVSRMKTETSVIPPTLLTVPPSDFTFLSTELANGAQVSGSIDVGGGGEIAFYVMNEGNFSNWRAGRPTLLVLAKSSTVFYNFTFKPGASGLYYFVFDNPSNNRRQVVFTLNATNNVVILSPVVQYLGFELLAAGILLSAFGLRGGREKPMVEAVKVGVWRCRFCGAENPVEKAFCAKCERSRL